MMMLMEYDGIMVDIATSRALCAHQTFGIQFGGLFRTCFVIVQNSCPENNRIEAANHCCQHDPTFDLLNNAMKNSPAQRINPCFFFAIPRAISVGFVPE